MTLQPKTLRGVRPAAALEIEYRRRILALVTQMQASVIREVVATYRARPPEVAALAADESPAAALRDAIRRLTRRWLKRFDDGAPRLAAWFAQSAARRSDAALRKILRDAGFTVEFKLTAAQNDVIQGAVAENVALIKSIPQRYMSQVEGFVMRSVQTGRDLGQLTKDLKEHCGVSQRQAELIARDQNNKATAVLTRARQLESGLTQAVWCHSAGGKTPRPSHVTAGRDRQVYDISLGWPDPALGGKKIFPGQEINCRCFSRPVVKGFS